jgi:uncharacterized membrane protein
MAERPGFDTSRLTTADKLVLGGGGLYFLWAFFPVWYRCCDTILGQVPVGGANGFRGVTFLAAILALLAVLEVAATKLASVGMTLPVRRGLVHLILGVLGLLLTVLGLVARPSTLGASFTLGWGIVVAVILALVWAYGAYMMYTEPADSISPPASGDPGGGFTS